MAQMVDYDLVAVAASTSEVKIFALVTGVGKGPLPGSTMLSKGITLVGHRREVIAIGFDRDLCASIATDNQAIITKFVG